MKIFEEAQINLVAIQSSDSILTQSGDTFEWDSYDEAFAQ